MPERLHHTPGLSNDGGSALGGMQVRRHEGASLRRLASWTGLVLQEADKLWGPPQACHGALPGGGWARDVRLEHGPERARAARVWLGALETGCSREAPPAPGDCR
jgi:hypothetical protein